MSTVVISALAAAAFAAVPPSIGSEPVPANFEYVPPPAQHVALQGPNLAVSLGSEPMLAGVESGAPQAATPGQSTAAPATLAESLGSEPLIVSFEEGASGTSGTAVGDTAAHAGTSPHRARLAPVAAPEAELEALLAPSWRVAGPEPVPNEAPDGRVAAAPPESAPGTSACTCTM